MTVGSDIRFRLGATLTASALFAMSACDEKRIVFDNAFPADGGEFLVFDETPVPTFRLSDACPSYTLIVNGCSQVSCSMCRYEYIASLQLESQAPSEVRIEIDPADIDGTWEASQVYTLTAGESITRQVLSLQLPNLVETRLCTKETSVLIDQMSSGEQVDIAGFVALLFLDDDPEAPVDIDLQLLSEGPNCPEFAP